MRGKEKCRNLNSHQSYLVVPHSALSPGNEIEKRAESETALLVWSHAGRSKAQSDCTDSYGESGQPHWRRDERPSSHTATETKKSTGHRRNLGRTLWGVRRITERTLISVCVVVFMCMRKVSVGVGGLLHTLATMTDVCDGSLNPFYQSQSTQKGPLLSIRWKQWTTYNPINQNTQDIPKMYRNINISFSEPNFNKIFGTKYDFRDARPPNVEGCEWWGSDGCWYTVA